MSTCVCLYVYASDHACCVITTLQVYNLELLKLKFGETNLNFCEVMIKDVADSRRINASLHQTTALKV